MTWLSLAWLAALLTAGTPPPRPAATAEAARLLAADAALDRAAAAQDRAAFAALLTPDTYWSGGGNPVIGPEAVLRDWDDYFQPGGPSLRWAPDRAEVAASGDLGFTEGQWTLTVRDPAGKESQHRGRYVTVWTRDADGAYRVAVDAALRPPSGSTGDLTRTPDRRATAASGELAIEAGRYALAAGAETGIYVRVLRRAGGAEELLVETLVPARPAK